MWRGLNTDVGRRLKTEVGAQHPLLAPPHFNHCYLVSLLSFYRIESKFVQPSRTALMTACLAYYEADAIDHERLAIGRQDGTQLLPTSTFDLRSQLTGQRRVRPSTICCTKYTSLYSRQRWADLPEMSIRFDHISFDST